MPPSSKSKSTSATAKEKSKKKTPTTTTTTAATKKVDKTKTKKGKATTTTTTTTTTGGGGGEDEMNVVLSLSDKDKGDVIRNVLDSDNEEEADGAVVVMDGDTANNLSPVSRPISGLSIKSRFRAIAISLYWCSVFCFMYSGALDRRSDLLLFYSITSLASESPIASQSSILISTNTL